MRLLLLLSVTLVLSGCLDQDTRQWTGEAQGKPVVVIAPAGLGPFQVTEPGSPDADLSAHADARTRWASEMADRFALRAGLPPTQSDWIARWSATLPAGDDAAWTASGVAINGHPDLIALAKIDSVQDQGSKGWVARASLVVRDAAGGERYRSAASGEALPETSPKFISPDSRPSRAAARAALRSLADDLAGYCARQGPKEVPADLVAIDLASDPTGADVLVDGAFKATTPCSLRLAPRPVTIRIERGGKSWQRTLTPEAGMRIAPTLEAAK
ncbi:hypothetical protein LBMAG53_05810 [Planctomycetota bacterium]|nr:hypothetical protein LBMAG53_05810 [Planctomycetota bacterium]